MKILRLLLIILLTSSCVDEAAYQEQIKALEIENARLRTEQNEYERIVASFYELDSSLRQLEDTLAAIEASESPVETSLVDSLLNVRDVLIERAQQVATYKDSLNDVRAESTRLRRLVRKYGNKIAAQKKNIDELAARITNLEQDKEELSTAVRTTRKELAETTDSLTKTQEQLAAERVERERTQERLENTRQAALEEKAKRLQTEAEQLTKKGDEISGLFMGKRKKREKKELYEQAIRKYQEIQKLGDFTLLQHPEYKIKALRDKIEALNLD